MTSAPEIVFEPTNSMTLIFLNEGHKMQYSLFAEDENSQFEAWKDWVTSNDGEGGYASELQILNAINYTGYVMELYCELGTQHGACGFSTADYGATLIASSATGEISRPSYGNPVSNTYWFTK